MRPSLERLKEHRFFMLDKPADYWQQIRNKSFQEVPYKPNPLKYAYLLQNEYPTVSNLVKEPRPTTTSRANTPAVAHEPASEPAV